MNILTKIKTIGAANQRKNSVLKEAHKITFKTAKIIYKGKILLMNKNVDVQVKTIFAHFGKIKLIFNILKGERLFCLRIQKGTQMSIFRPV